MHKQPQMHLSARLAAAGPRTSDTDAENAANAAAEPVASTNTGAADQDPAAKDGARRRTFLAKTATGAWIEPDWAGDPDEFEGPTDGCDDVAPTQDSGHQPEQPDSVPGHYVMDRSAITAALAASGFDGTYEALSSGEEQRVRALQNHQSRSLFKPHLIGSPGMIEQLEALNRKAPNFGPVTRIVRRAAIVSQRAGSALRVPPMVFVGNPGVGKSRYARLLAEALQTSCNIVNGSTLPDVGSLTGYPPVWRGSGAGRIAKYLVSSLTSGPLVFVDEAEKIRDYEEMSNPLDRLLPLLEYDTACTFQDENLQVPMRAQNAILLFACNNLDGLSAPFLDRVLVIEVPDLAPTERDEAFAALLDTIATARGLRMSLASTEALAPIRALGMRRARIAFEIAMGSAAEANRAFLTAADLAAAAALLDAGAERRRPIGFIQTRADRG